MSKRRIVTLVGMLATIALVAGPARGAAPPPLLVNKSSGGGIGQYRVDAACEAVVGATTNLNVVRYQVTGTSVAQGPTLPAATGIECTIKDRKTGTIYGTIAHALPGPVGATFGGITVPLGSHPMICSYGSALYTNNVYKETFPTTGC